MDIIKAKCPRCGNEDSYQKFTDNSEFGECTKCGWMTYHKWIGTPPTTIKTVEVKCPYCNSTNTKKISEMSKAASVAVFGVFAMGKVSKQWHCNNCKSDF